MRINDWSSDVCSSDLSTEAPYNDRPNLLASDPMSQKQWIAGINAVSAAIEHDADNVREVLLEAGAKNPRLAEIESNARRFGIDVRRVNQQALRSEEHTSELQSLMRTSYAVYCLKT